MNQLSGDGLKGRKKIPIVSWCEFFGKMFCCRIAKGRQVPLMRDKRESFSTMLQARKIQTRILENKFAA